MKFFSYPKSDLVELKDNAIVRALKGSCKKDWNLPECRAEYKALIKALRGKTSGTTTAVIRAPANKTLVAIWALAGLAFGGAIEGYIWLTNRNAKKAEPSNS